MKAILSQLFSLPTCLALLLLLPYSLGLVGKYQTNAPHQVFKKANQSTAFISPSYYTYKRKPRLQGGNVCLTDQIRTASESTVVDIITRSADEYDCYNEWYYLDSRYTNQFFTNQKAQAVAEEIRRISDDFYRGNNDQSILQLILYLRSGYYNRYIHNQGEWSDSTASYVDRALDSFFRTYYSTNSINEYKAGQICSEAVILIDSARINLNFLYVMETILKLPQSLWLDTSGEGCVAATATVIFGLLQRRGALDRVSFSSTITNTLYDFILSIRDQMGSNNEYLVTDAVGNFALFVEYSDRIPSYESNLLSMLSIFLSQEKYFPAWVRLAENLNYVDPNACERYDTCDLADTLLNRLFKVNTTCQNDNNILILAQSLTTSEKASICAEVGEVEENYHQIYQTNRVSVDPYMDRLQITIFNSDQDYGRYGYAIFQIDTNNGGLYLEGDPSRRGNLPVFYCYKNTRVLPLFEVWNLRHEFTHYLDSKFTWKGRFPSFNSPVVWYIEGAAVYVDPYPNIYPPALSTLETSFVSLSDTIMVDYRFDESRVYHWTYWAMRFFLERKPSMARQMRSYLVQGDYTGFSSYCLNTIGNSYDAEFEAWVLQFRNV